MTRSRHSRWIEPMTRSAKGFCQGARGGDDELVNAHVLHSPLEVSPVDGVAIAEQVGGSGLVGEGVDELLGGPRGGGLVSDAEVDKFSAVVTEDHEAKEQPEGEGRDDEEVDRGDLVTMRRQKGAPRRRWGMGRAAHVLGDGEGGDVIAEEAEFGLNPAPTPGGVVSGHASNEGAELEVE